MSKSDLPAHLLLAEMALKRARKSMQGKVRKSVRSAATSGSGPGTENSKTSGLAKAAVFYGVSRLATRSVPGAILVGGGLLAKTLIERRRSGADTQREE